MNRLILFLIGIVLVGVAGFAMLWFGTGRELQAPAVAFLIECRDEKFQEAYDATHPRFREGQTREQMQALWEYWKEKHGVFGEVLQRLSVQTRTSEEGWTRNITLELGFYNGHMLGRFYFRTVEGEPRLVHVWLGRKPTVEVEASERSSLEPAARALLGHLSAGAFAAFYGALDPELQMATTQKRIAENLGVIRSAMGPVKTITLVRTVDGAEDGHVAQIFNVIFENGTQELEITHEHDRGQWSIVGFKGL